jgi:trans-2,3-dihydro-3-hydroxyanthranilate isomerase
MDVRRAEPGVLTVHHVDVFTDRALAGNGLTVVSSATSLDPDTMLRIAQELRQFETIFLFEVVDGGAGARIFTPEEELAFAGHPVLGAAAVLHAESRRPGSEIQDWTLRVGGRPLGVTTAARDGGVIWAEMDQGPADVLAPLSPDVATRLAAAVGVEPSQLRRDLPTQVVSTGLRYLLLPVTVDGLAASHGADPELPSMLHEVGADFVYVLEPDRPEGRTWDNSGLTEDVATGSAAGPTAAYLISHGLRSHDEHFQVHQGRFVGRPSRIDVHRTETGSLRVGGLVAPFSRGTIETSAVQGLASADM